MALDCLGRAIAERNALRWWFRYSPLFEELRGDPRAEALVQRIVPE